MKLFKLLMILKIDADYIAVGGDTNRGSLPWPVSPPAIFAPIVVLLIKV
jgi:hypothetical protein